MTKSFELDISRFVEALDGAAETIGTAAKNGLHDALDEWLHDAVDLAPMDKSTLRRGISTDITGEGANLTGEISAVAIEVPEKGKWAGKRFNYAYYLHEVYPEKYGRRYFKNPTTPGTIPEFIDTPAIYKGDEWLRDIEAEIEREIKRKGW